MSNHHSRDEKHACIVCGKLYSLKVVYDSDGLMAACEALSPEARILPYPDQPLVACLIHPGDMVGAALAQQFFGSEEHDHEHYHDHDHAHSH